MVKIINQDTFNDAVKENQEMFDLNIEDAVKETVEQFEKQGVDLSNIIKDLSVQSKDVKMEKQLEELIPTLRFTLGSKNNKEKIELLGKLKKECDIDIAHRLFVGKNGGYNLLICALSQHMKQFDVAEKILEVLTSLMTGQPDLLDQKGVVLMNELLTHSKLRVLTLKWIKTCCIKHENNRQIIFNSDILTKIKELLIDPESSNPQIIREVCAVCRSLVLDDDIRVEFGNAHEHAKAIAMDTIHPLLKLLETFKSDEGLVSELMLTLASLLVRAEFCKIVQDAGGIDFLLEALITFAGKEQVVKQGLKLIKALAGNDDCKYYIIRKGGAPPMAAVLDLYKTNSHLAHINLSALAAVALRAPENSEALYSAGVADLVVECMNLHPMEWKIQQAASWVIRNMVCRNKEQSKYFVSIGAETELNKALQKHGKECEYDIKSALRDLGCYVVLKEEWTGKGGRIFTEESVTNFQARYD